MVNDDIDAIIVRGEERTLELNSKYEGLSFEDLSNFKSEASVQQWEGEDFRGNRKTLQFNPLALSKRERKLNYSVDSYFKETMRAGPSKTEKPPKIPRAPKQIQMQDFQFFPPRLAELQERELAAHKVGGWSQFVTFLILTTHLAIQRNPCDDSRASDRGRYC